MASDVNAQDAVVAGTVVTEESGEPLAAVNVYISQTTWGTSTTSDGRFEIASIPPGEYTVVASMLGYRSVGETIEITPGTRTYRLNFRLSESVVELNAIEVETDRPREWERNLRRFEEHFIGRSGNAELTDLVNPYVLEFETVGGELYARAESPLTIENRALGYKLTFNLRRYAQSDVILQMFWQVRFEEMEPSNDVEAERWRTRRQRAYEGSLMHFLRALVNGSLREEGFSAEHRLRQRTTIRWVQVGAFPILEATDQPYLYRFFFDDELYVSYGSRESGLSLTRDEAMVHRNGYVYGSNALEPPLIVAGDMAARGVADMLPLNYGL